MEDSTGMGISGFIFNVLTTSSPSGAIFKMEISTIRSVAIFTPVVSRSKKANGRFNLSLSLQLSKQYNPHQNTNCHYEIKQDFVSCKTLIPCPEAVVFLFGLLGFHCAAKVRNIS